MEVLEYMAPAVSFPRYEYSKRHVSRVIDDFHILMKDLKLDFSELSVPEYSDVEIFVTKGKQSNNFVDERYIGLRNINKVKFKCTRTFKNVDDVLKSNMQEADIAHPKIIVVSASSVSDMEPFVPFHLNAVIVAEDEQLEDQIKACIKENYREENSISVTTRENLGMTICLLLERVVFRNLREFVYVLKELMEVAMFERRIVITDDITYLLKSFLENDDCFMGWLKETEGYEEKSTNHKNTKTRFSTDHCVKDELEYKKKERKLVPDYLKAVPDIEERYIMDNWVIYELAYKLSRHVAMVTKQRVFTEYKKITPMFRTKIGIEIDYETIRSSTAECMLELFISTVPKYTVVAKYEYPGDILLGFLRKEKSTILQGIKQMTENLEFARKVDMHLALLKGESDTSIVQLLEDIMGLCYRSKVPKFEQPTRGRREHVVELTDKAKQRLFKDVKLAKGCGYRYNKLHIYVEETKDNELIHSMQKKIKALLLRYNITDFVVCQLSPLTYLHEVGAEIHIRSRKGTLGGFAHMGPQNKLCALLSKHVANGATTVCLAENDAQLGRMVNTVCDTARSVDIAAAEIRADMQHKCEIRFKDSNRKPLPSQLCPIETKDWLKNLPVFFYGASTKFSEGKITIPELSLDETGNSYIIIEGNKGKGEFSKQGDSGAVICADDPDGEYVHVISMLIGQYSQTGLKEEKTQQYITFMMAHGLQHLSETTGQQFKLCL